MTWWDHLVAWAREHLAPCSGPLVCTGPIAAWEYVPRGLWRCRNCGDTGPIAELLARHGHPPAGPIHEDLAIVAGVVAPTRVHPSEVA